MKSLCLAPYISQLAFKLYLPPFLHFIILSQYRKKKKTTYKFTSSHSYAPIHKRTIETKQGPVFTHIKGRNETTTKTEIEIEILSQQSSAWK